MVVVALLCLLGTLRILSPPASLAQLSEAGDEADSALLRVPMESEVAKISKARDEAVASVSKAEIAELKRDLQAEKNVAVEKEAIEEATAKKHEPSYFSPDMAWMECTAGWDMYSLRGYKATRIAYLPTDALLDGLQGK